jgi:hypothetical protein
MRGKKATFWVAVSGVSLLAPVGLNLLADSKVGDVFPAIRTLNNYTTRRNG